MDARRQNSSNISDAAMVREICDGSHTLTPDHNALFFEPGPPKSQYDVLIVGGDPLQRELLELVLGQVPELGDVRVAGDIESVVDIARDFSPDVVLVDTPVTLGVSRIEIGRAVRLEFPRAGIVILADRLNASRLRGSVFADGPGWSYILKETCKGAGDLVQIILAAASGMTIIDPIYIASTGNDEPRLEFTKKQREVLAFVAEGLSNEAVAKNLGITVRTVEYHLNEVYQRFERSRSQYVNPRVLAATYFVRSQEGHAPAPSREGAG